MEEREITVKLKWNFDEAKVHFVNKGIQLVDSFVIKDIYLIKEDLDIDVADDLEVLSSCLILRDIAEDKLLIYKDKKYNENGEIVSSNKYQCLINDIDDMYELLTRIGYKECFRYEQDCLAFKNKSVDILLQYIPELGLFAELENSNKSVKELIEDLNSLEIPYYENDYFVKKASLMLDEVRKYGR